MFWDFMLAGLTVLTYWEVYVAVLEYFAISYVPIFFIGMVMEKIQGDSVLTGCLGILILPVFQVVAIAVMILSIAPIIFGFADDAVWNFPWLLFIEEPVAFFKIIGVMVVASIVLSLMPIINQLQSLHTLVIGSIALLFVLSAVDAAYPNTVKDHVVIIPGFWFTVGIIVVGGIMSWVGVMVVNLIAIATAMEESHIAALTMISIKGIFGFFPVFMYGAWLGEQVSGSF